MGFWNKLFKKKPPASPPGQDPAPKLAQTGSAENAADNAIANSPIPAADFAANYAANIAPNGASIPADAPADHDDDIDEDDDDCVSTIDALPVSGPPEFIRVVELHRQYWTFNADEQAQLAAREPQQLSWHEKLRLHHLNCLQRLQPGIDQAAANATCLRSAEWLLAENSPWCPRPAMIWQGQQSGGREPDLSGNFLNPSLTHIGALEIFHLDANDQVCGIGFVGFDELTDVIFGPPGMVRLAKLFYENGQSLIVQMPLLYGLSWCIGSEIDRSGRMTRFVKHLANEHIGKLGIAGIGVGQQDFVIRNRDGGASLFGLGSVSEICFPLDMNDPRFDEKARARGIDPDEVRRSQGPAR